ncbi:MAG: hypothetical protein Q9187_002596 [Circinaria calcarea]
MEFIFYVHKLMKNILHLLRSIFHRPEGAAAAALVQDQPVPEQPVPSQTTLDYPVANQHAISDQPIVSEPPLAPLAIQNIAEELPRPVRSSSPIQTPARRYPADPINSENSPSDLLKGKHLKARSRASTKSSPLSDNGSFDTDEKVEDTDGSPDLRLSSPIKISNETYKSIPKPQYPIRISNFGPQPFSLEKHQHWVRWWRCLLDGYDQDWKAEPDVQLIKPTVKPVLEMLGMDGSKIEIASVGEGAYNKVYSVTTSHNQTGASKEYIFRIPLPIDPYYKIECEVATTEYVRHFTSIPVPIIYAYDSSLDNELGLEWMLMERIVGTPLAESWLDLENGQHVLLMKQVADWQNELIGNRASKIGGLYLRWTDTDMEFFVGPSIHEVFYMDRRLLYQPNRGPFDSFRDFTSAALQVQLQELNDPYHQPLYKIEKVRGQSSGDYKAAVKHAYPHFTDDDVDDYRRRITYGLPAYDLTEVIPEIQALLDSLPRVCPVSEEDYMTLAHNDISAMNIMINPQGEITALLDWENVEFRPMEFIEMYPRILVSEDLPDLYDVPANIEFQNDEPEEWARVENHWSDILATKLRPIYSQHLQDIRSILTILDDQEGFWYKLKDRALHAAMSANNTKLWVEYWADGEEDTENSEKESESNVQGGREISTIESPPRDDESCGNDERMEGNDRPLPKDSGSSNNGESMVDADSAPLSDHRPANKVEDIEDAHTHPSLISSSPVEISYETYKSVAKPKYPIRISQAGPRPFSLAAQRRWIRWKHDLYWGPEAYWIAEPDIELIKQTIAATVEQLGSNSKNLVVTFMAEGGFNSVFKISTVNKEDNQQKEYIFRLSQPVDPFYKTESEVATIELARHFTSIPVPRIYAYDSSFDNPLGLEWMLMEKVYGKSLGSDWIDMDNEDHKFLTKQVAGWQDELARLQSNRIGGVYLRWTETDLEFYIGPSTDFLFSRDRRSTYEVNRGPFMSLLAFYNAALEIYAQEMADPINKLSSEVLQRQDQTYEEFREAKRAKESRRKELAQISKEALRDWEEEENRKEYGPQSKWNRSTAFHLKTLQNALPRLCAVKTGLDFLTCLSHPDISVENLLADSNGKLVALLDWERAEFEPLMFKTAYPPLLDSEDCSEAFDAPFDSSFQDTPENWRWLKEKQEYCIRTHLRDIYRQQLEELGSPLLACFQEENDREVALREKVLDQDGPSSNLEGIEEWVNGQMTGSVHQTTDGEHIEGDEAYADMGGVVVVGIEDESLWEVNGKSNRAEKGSGEIHAGFGNPAVLIDT